MSPSSSSSLLLLLLSVVLVVVVLVFLSAEQMEKKSFVFNERALKALIKGYSVLKRTERSGIVGYPEDADAVMSRIQLAIGRSAVKTSGSNCAGVIADAEERVYCKALAIKAYELAIGHDPTNEEARAFLDKMNDDTANKIHEKSYVKKMLETFEKRRMASFEAGRDEL